MRFGKGVCFVLNKIRSVMFGHAVGDALGVPVEFCGRDVLELNPVADMIGFGTYNLPAGTWSDDTSMSLCALESLSKGILDYNDIMRNFCKWYYDEDFTADGEVFDIGSTCVSAIYNYSDLGMSVNKCGMTSERSNGNGSLMRIHPFVLYAFYNGINNGDFVRMIVDASSLTHAHSISTDGCIIYAYVLRALLENPSRESIYNGLNAASYDVYHHPDTHYKRILEQDISKMDKDNIKSTGYVVSSLEAAIWCLLTTNSYKECVLQAVNLGGDTDTIAAIAGSLAGALYGFDSIPTEWLNILKRNEYIDNMCENAYNKWMLKEAKVCDIHAHIIPGVDDGASNFNMAIDILRSAYNQGTRDIICTSHSGYNTRKYLANFEELKRRLEKENIQINIYSGCEIYCTSDIVDKIVSNLKNKEILTINETGYILVEFNTNASVREIMYCVKFLQDNGYKIIIAHAERYVNLRVGHILPKILHNMGCLFQINAYSFYNTRDEEMKSFARWMLNEKYVTFVGSDVHHTDYRRYAIEDGINYIYQNCSEEYAKEICYQNAKNIFNIK